MFAAGVRPESKKVGTVYGKSLQRLHKNEIAFSCRVLGDFEMVFGSSFCFSSEFFQSNFSRKIFFKKKLIVCRIEFGNWF